MSDKLLIDRKLLERLQERLDPHIDARDWGMVCDAFRAQAKAAPEAEPVEAWLYTGDYLKSKSYGAYRFSGIQVEKWGTYRCVHLEPDRKINGGNIRNDRVVPLYAAPQHDAELVEGGLRLEGLTDVSHQLGMLYLHFKNTDQLHVALRELRAKLATLSAKNEGGKV